MTAPRPERPSRRADSRRSDAAPDGKRRMMLQTVLNVVLGASTLLLALILWSVKRHRDPNLEIPNPGPLVDLIPSLAGLTHGRVVAGNSVDVFENGAFFEAMFEDLRQARVSVHFETFLWKDGALGQRLVEALLERRRAGLEVRVLVDADGGKEMGEQAQQRLREAGCKFALYHRKQLRNIGKINRRDHRKLLVLDGRVGFAGGHCIVDLWLGDARNSKEVRDVGVRVRGPAVHTLQSTFSENWVDATGELFLGNHVFPPLEPTGTVSMHVASIKPEGAPPGVKILHHLVLCLAQKRLWIQNPYFLPDSEAIKALVQAAGRGVDVRVMVPSAEASDFPTVQHAAHRNFETLLAGGVRIFEYPRTLLHQKMLTIDGVWSAIGSANFDDRSFEINDEITLGLLDPDLARQFEAIFERDAVHCVELEHESWRQRGLWHRLKDSALYMFNEQL
jgi:cardiolipin synthase